MASVSLPAAADLNAEKQGITMQGRRVDDPAGAYCEFKVSAQPALGPSMRATHAVGSFVIGDLRQFMMRNPPAGLLVFPLDGPPVAPKGWSARTSGQTSITAIGWSVQTEEAAIAPGSSLVFTMKLAPDARSFDCAQVPWTAGQFSPRTARVDTTPMLLRKPPPELSPERKAYMDAWTEKLMAERAKDPAAACAALGKMAALDQNQGDAYDLGKCQQALGHKQEAIATFTKLLDSKKVISRRGALVPLAELGIRVPGPDVKVEEGRDPASYRRNCVTLAEPSTCGRGIYACGELVEDEMLFDGTRGMVARLTMSTNREELEPGERSRNKTRSFTAGKLHFRCAARDVCEPISCGGPREANSGSCRKQARLDCDQALLRCKAPPPEITPGDCVIVKVDPCNEWVGLVCNGKAEEFIGKPEVIFGSTAAAAAQPALTVRPPPPPPLPAASAGLLACCAAGPPHDSKPAATIAELVAALGAGTHRVADVDGKPVYIDEDQVIAALISRGDKSAVPGLKELLKARSPAVRANAARVLVKLTGDEDAFAQLLADAKTPTPSPLGPHRMGTILYIPDRDYAIHALAIDQIKTPH